MTPVLLVSLSKTQPEPANNVPMNVIDATKMESVVNAVYQVTLEFSLMVLLAVYLSSVTMKTKQEFHPIVLNYATVVSLQLTA